jgi:hypothetical protein
MKVFGTLCFIFFIANTYTITKADEDDDFAEALIDFGTGVAISACEADEGCRVVSGIIAIPFILIYICLLCSGGIDLDDFEPPPTKRLIRTGVGYAVGRQILN